MTDLLTETLHERADALPAPQLDVTAMIHTGDRRLRRRRAAVRGGLAAAALTVAVTVPWALGGGDAPRGVDDGGLTAAFAAHAPSYAVGSVVRLDDESFDVGHDIRAYVQTDDGVVFSDPSGVVYAANGGEVTEVGRIDAKYPRLVAGGPRAAWVEPQGNQAPVFVVYDQSAGEVSRSALDNVAGMSDLRDGRDPAVVYAVDGATVWVRSHTGVLAWDTATDTHEVMATDADGFTISDVKNGLIATEIPDDAGSTVTVGPRVGEGTSLPLWSAYYLSPSGRYFLGEPEPDDVRVYDTSTGKAMPENTEDYGYFGAYQWIDDEHYAALGVDVDEQGAGTSAVDIFRCTVATGACTRVADDVGTLDGGFTLPVGEYIN